MGFHRRHIDNEQVISIYLERGTDAVIDWYTKGVDALVLETGIASDIDDILGLANITIADKNNQISDMLFEASTQIEG